VFLDGAVSTVLLYVGDSTRTTAAPQQLNQKRTMLEKNFDQFINTQTNTIDNSPAMGAKSGWWEEDEGVKVPMNGATNCT
jgi:hypothetical protein